MLIHAARFSRYLPNQVEGSCWLWSGRRNRHGYGVYSVGSRVDRTKTQWYAHRVAWTLAHGEIPPGMLICHHCDTPPCCNPAHLFLGTAKDNVHDAQRKGRVAAGSRHGRTPFADADVLAIRATPTCRGVLLRLANQYGVTPAAIRNIRTGRTWRGLPGRLSIRRGAPHGNAVLDEAAVRVIRATPTARGAIKALALRYGVSKSCLDFIRSGKTWRHVTICPTDSAFRE